MPQDPAAMGGGAPMPPAGAPMPTGVASPGMPMMPSGSENSQSVVM
jgi:hypothetical protein